MRHLLMVLALSSPVQAIEWGDGGLEDSTTSFRRDDTLLPAPSTDRYFGGYNDPAVVVPIQPGTGSSYIGRDQVMTDHQYCFRSAVSGALICQGH